MARQIQIRRGTAAEHKNFTGAIGEITMDTTNNTIRIHDGATLGGVPLARADEIMPSKAPGVAIPDTDKQMNIGAYDTYTFPSDGWLFIRTNVASSVQFVSDKYETSQYGPFSYGCLNPEGTCQSLMYRVQSGETITKTYVSGNWIALFIPCKD